MKVLVSLVSWLSRRFSGHLSSTKYKEMCIGNVICEHLLTKSILEPDRLSAFFCARDYFVAMISFLVI